MKKILCLLLTTCILISGMPVHLTADEYITVQDAIDDANSFLSTKLGIGGYYKNYIMRNGIKLPIVESLAKGGSDAFYNKPAFAYETKEAASKEMTTNGREFDEAGQFRAVGYARDGSGFPNPKFTADNDGFKDNNKKWVKRPWALSEKSKLYAENGKVYERSITGNAKSYINNWINENRFTPEDLVSAGKERNYFTAHAENVPDRIKNNFEDFLYIIQPPTEHSWGLGIAFYYWDGFNRLNYRSFLIEPFDMAKSDLSASFDEHPLEAEAGTDLNLTVRVKSTFEILQTDVHYKWQVVDNITHTPITASFSGAVIDPEGNLSSIAANGVCEFNVAFKMPEHDVSIQFEINKDGTKPDNEKTLDNNHVAALIKAKMIASSGFDLDYDILSRKIYYGLSDYDIIAQLSKPMGVWINNATGSLDVINKTPTLLRDFYVTNNPPVNEDSEKIVRRPVVHATIMRPDFEDDPVNHHWLNWTPPSVPKIRVGDVSYDGSVSRTYKYTVYTLWGSYTVEVPVTVLFNSGVNHNTIRARIYNGKENITPKTFSNRIDHNNQSALSKDLFWRSEPYIFNVMRWMYHQNEDNSLYDPTRVDGQYDRTFTQQCTGQVEWATVDTMAHDYERGREAAKHRDYRKSEYDKAVFASDIDFYNVDYPIKSGYYFNPTGEYTFTVETVTYKTTTADTKDHKDLVNAVIHAFRYESDLMYINDSKQAVNLQDELLPTNGPSYSRRSACLTASDPTGVNDTVLLKVLDRSDSASRYSKVVEEIQHSEDINGDTHTYWKEILEGYAESDTQDSKDHYKYREYVKDGQHIYRITEKTKVTIQINPENKSIYTHAHMPDGEYTVKAWIDDVSLARIDNEYKKLGTLRGISSLDEIKVSVRGSMYDDVR